MKGAEAEAAAPLSPDIVVVIIIMVLVGILFTTETALTLILSSLSTRVKRDTMRFVIDCDGCDDDDCDGCDDDDCDGCDDVDNDDDDDDFSVGSSPVPFIDTPLLSMMHFNIPIKDVIHVEYFVNEGLVLVTSDSSRSTRDSNLSCTACLASNLLVSFSRDGFSNCGVDEVGSEVSATEVVE